MRARRQEDLNSFG
jgi:hypothetical protein